MNRPSQRRILAEFLIYLAGMIDRDRPLLTMDDDNTPGVWVVRYPGRDTPVFSIHEKDMPYMQWQNNWPSQEEKDWYKKFPAYVEWKKRWLP